MLSIPGATAEELIKLSLRPGSVFHFAHTPFNTDNPHYFFVLNQQPLTDAELIMVHATSQVDKARLYCAKYPDTLVELSPADYPDFTEPISAINCGMVTIATVRELAGKLARNQLRLCTHLDQHILQMLRTAVRASPTVERRYQKLLAIVIE